MEGLHFSDWLEKPIFDLKFEEFFDLYNEPYSHKIFGKISYTNNYLPIEDIRTNLELAKEQYIIEIENRSTAEQRDELIKLQRILSNCYFAKSPKHIYIELILHQEKILFKDLIEEFYFEKLPEKYKKGLSELVKDVITRLIKEVTQFTRRENDQNAVVSFIGFSKNYNSILHKIYDGMVVTNNLPKNELKVFLELINGKKPISPISWKGKIKDLTAFIKGLKDNDNWQSGYNKHLRHFEVAIQYSGKTGAIKSYKESAPHKHFPNNEAASDSDFYKLGKDL